MLVIKSSFKEILLNLGLKIPLQLIALGFEGFSIIIFNKIEFIVRRNKITFRRKKKQKRHFSSLIHMVFPVELLISYNKEVYSNATDEIESDSFINRIDQKIITLNLEVTMVVCFFLLIFPSFKTDSQ